MRAQLDAVELPPFSGEGLLNEILQLITSSLTNLLIVILSPLLLLTLVFVTMSRLRTKRLLEEQDQELAESTASLMEEPGQFDNLLTDDVSEDEDELMPEPEGHDEKVVDTLEEINLDEDDEELDLDVVDLTEDDEELITDNDDPFGIDAISDSDDEELISSNDLDNLNLDEDTEIDEDDLLSIDLDDDFEDPFGVDELLEQEATSEEEINLDQEIDLEKEINLEEEIDLDESAKLDSEETKQPTEAETSRFRFSRGMGSTIIK
ncbi:hypothetical protein ACLKMH_13575 [Psychromonas sp. KJ10-10]|uniref:hypothetical protein n=1 Tax=Psychromonas sp. KJ10-10 TaxID=3391823 RepID=UPI0039B57B15